MTKGERRATKEAWDPRDLAVRSIVFHFDTKIHQNLFYLLLIHR